MIELTRELLERYLRAIGHPIRPAETIALNEGTPLDLAIDGIALWLGLTRSAFAFRLGLCAAAEDMLSSVRNWRLSYGAQASALAPVDPFEGLANALLRAAGIDPAAWEAAR